MLVKERHGRCDRNHANGAPLPIGEPELTPSMLCEPPSFRDSLRDAPLKLAEGRRKKASQGVRAPTGEENAKCEQELRKSVLHAIVRKVEAMRKMDQEDRTGHHDHDAESTNADKGPSKQSESTRKLRKTYQEADDYRGVQETRKAMNAGAPKGAKENGAAVVEKNECAGEAEDEQGEIDIAESSRRRRRWRSHKTILINPRPIGGFAGNVTKEPGNSNPD